MFSNMTTNMFEGALRLPSTGRTIAMSIVDNALPATIDVQPYRAGKTSKLVNSFITNNRYDRNIRPWPD